MWTGASDVKSLLPLKPSSWHMEQGKIRRNSRKRRLLMDRKQRLRKPLPLFCSHLTLQNQEDPYRNSQPHLGESHEELHGGLQMARQPGLPQIIP